MAPIKKLKSGSTSTFIPGGTGYSGTRASVTFYGSSKTQEEQTTNTIKFILNDENITIYNQYGNNFKPSVNDFIVYADNNITYLLCITKIDNDICDTNIIDSWYTQSQIYSESYNTQQIDPNNISLNITCDVYTKQTYIEYNNFIAKDPYNIEPSYKSAKYETDINKLETESFCAFRFKLESLNKYNISNYKVILEFITDWSSPAMDTKIAKKFQTPKVYSGLNDYSSYIQQYQTFRGYFSNYSCKGIRRENKYTRKCPECESTYVVFEPSNGYMMLHCLSCGKDVNLSKLNPVTVPENFDDEKLDNFVITIKDYNDGLNAMSYDSNVYIPKDVIINAKNNKHPYKCNMYIYVNGINGTTEKIWIKDLSDYINKSVEINDSRVLECIYKINNPSLYYTLFNKLEFVDNPIPFTDIEIDGVPQQEITNKYKFETEGLHIVKFTLIDPTSIPENLFNNIDSLISVNIPDSISSIGDNVFYDCNELESINMPNSVISMGNYTFYNCYKLTSVDIPDYVTSIGNGTFSNCTGLTSINIPNYVTSIGESAFYNCSGLTSVNIPNSVKTISYNAFQNCSNLTSVNIGKSVTFIGNGAFSYCTRLTSVDIPDSVNYICAETFKNCSNLTSVTIGSKSIEFIGNGAFYDCSSLSSINMPDYVTSIGEGAFYNCSSLTSINIPDSVTLIRNSAFYNCTGLTSINIPDSVTSINKNVFYNCSGLTSVTIGKSVTSIDSSAFYNCSGLTSVEIPDSVASIGNGAFSNCSGLTSVIIGKSVTSIGYAAFSNCTNLDSIESYPYYAPSIQYSVINGKLQEQESDTFYNIKYDGTLYLHGAPLDPLNLVVMNYIDWGAYLDSKIFNDRTVDIHHWNVIVVDHHTTWNNSGGSYSGSGSFDGSSGSGGHGSFGGSGAHRE